MLAVPYLRRCLVRTLIWSHKREVDINSIVPDRWSLRLPIVDEFYEMEFLQLVQIPMNLANISINETSRLTATFCIEMPI